MSGRRRTRRDKRNMLGLVYGGIGAAIIVAIVASATVLNLGRRDLDKMNCPTDRLDSVTVVLIDLTDPLNPVQAAALRNAMLKVRDAIPRFGKLEIYPLRSVAQRTIAPLFESCNPGSAKDVESPVYGNPELADRTWRKKFADKLEPVLAEIQTLPVEDNSPILEGVQSVAVTAFGRPSTEGAREKRLVLISDMIHFTPSLSMYRTVPDFESFKGTTYFLQIKPNLQGANVDVFLIVRASEKNVQQPPLYKFWVEFFAAGNGYLRDWNPLQ